MYILDTINPRIVDDFINNLSCNKSNLIQDLHQYAIENKVPIIKDDVSSFIRNILLTKKPKRILELGTAIGYSAILMAETLSGNCTIDTIEKNNDMHEIAVKNIRSSGYKINPIHGDALAEIKKLENTYDFVFIDAAKGHYKEFFDLIIPKLNNEAIIIGDNILHKGLVCLPLNEVPRRQRTIVRNMKAFIDYIYANDNIRTSILPIGDGLMVNNILNTL